MTRLDDALVRASDVLNELGKGFALVGGIAVSALMAPSDGCGHTQTDGANSHLMCTSIRRTIGA